jgi:hypothetical protein
MTRLAKVQLSTELLEAILTAKNNDFVTTDCPQDIKIVKVFQDEEDQSNHRVTLMVNSEDESWPDSPKEQQLRAFAGDPVGIPLLNPFQYTVVDPDEDESPPVTEEIAP